MEWRVINAKCRQSNTSARHPSPSSQLVHGGRCRPSISSSSSGGFHNLDVSPITFVAPVSHHQLIPSLSDSPRIVAAFMFIWLSVIGGGSGGVPGAGTPCIFEGHLKTDRNWFGYLANVSVVTTARMTFEFTYAADRCCQTILFYTDEQTSIINARMNCWQKEYLVRPEDDQMLRLTPRFAWSGCHMTHPAGMSTYHCEGGRSFTVDQPSANSGAQAAGAGPGSMSATGGVSGGSGGLAPHPSTWYVAVSNCAALHGLDLRYRLVVYGHVGDCPPAVPAVSAAAQAASASRSSLGDGISYGTALGVSGESGEDDDGGDSNAPDVSCRLEGEINSTSNWFGFIANASLARGAGFRFQFKFPSTAGVGGGIGSAVDSFQTSIPRIVRVLLYSADDVTKLSAEQTCWQRDGIIRQRNQPEQVIELSSQSSFSGCITAPMKSNAANTGGVVRTEVSCRGERRYDQPQRMHVAISDCRSVHGLQLHYELEFYGYTNAQELCSFANRNSPSLCRTLTSFVIAVVVVVVAMATAN